MSTKYLLHFVHEHIAFRYAEFLAVTSKYNCKFKLLSKNEHLQTKPFIIIELTDGSPVENLIDSVRGSYLLKDLYELWGHSSKSIEDLSNNASKSRQFLSNTYTQADQSFRVNVETFRGKINQSSKLELIRNMTIFDSFKAKPNLTEPKQTYAILIMNRDENQNQLQSSSKDFFFGRHLTQGDRTSIHNFSLKTRKFIANTSMDPTLSLITANCAKINHNHLVYDPFVGSGSLLIAAAYKGAYVIGGDIDWLLMHAKSKPSRKGKAKWEEDETLEANFKQYNLEKYYLGVMVSDVSRKPFRDDIKFDAIVADPPYGVRECSEKIGTTKSQVLRDQRARFPSKISYSIAELMKDLILLSAKNLSLGGRLVYWLPVAKMHKDDSYDDYIPQHSCLELISYSEQVLFSKISRLMVVMEKRREPEDCDSAHVPDMISKMNFRDNYFANKN